MDKFLIICTVAADFYSRSGELFRIPASRLGEFIEAPVWIKDTLLFRGLVSDGSLKVAEKHISRKEGENDPMKDVGADGKAKAEAAEAVEEATEEAPQAETIKTRRRSKKDDAK